MGIPFRRTFWPLWSKCRWQLAAAVTSASEIPCLPRASSIGRTLGENVASISASPISAHQIFPPMELLLAIEILAGTEKGACPVASACLAMHQMLLGSVTEGGLMDGVLEHDHHR